MEEVTKLNPDLLANAIPGDRRSKTKSWTSYLPVIFVFVGSFLMLGLRLEIGKSFISDGALMMLALASYILAALFQLTNLYAPSEMSTKIGYWGAAIGVFFNLSSWLVRWVAGYEHEIAQMRAAGNRQRRGSFAIFLSPIFTTSASRLRSVPALPHSCSPAAEIFRYLTAFHAAAGGIDPDARAVYRKRIHRSAAGARFILAADTRWRRVV